MEIARSLIIRYYPAGQWSIGGSGNTSISTNASDDDYLDMLDAVNAFQAVPANEFLLQRVFGV